MKKFILTVATLALLTACSNNAPNDEQFGPIVLSRSGESIVKGMNRMAFDWIAREYADMDDSLRENIILPPFSLQTSIGMLTNADEKDYDNVAKAYGAENCKEWNTFNYDIARCLPKVDPLVSFTSFNYFWITDKYPYSKDCLDNIILYYKPTVLADGLGVPDLENAILNDAKKATDMPFDIVLPSPNNEKVDAIACNTTFFHGEWADAFDRKDTKIEAFCDKDSNEVIKVNLMHGIKNLRYAEIPNAKAVALPYGNGSFEMVAILPDLGVNLGEYLKSLNVESFDKTLATMNTERVDIALPRFATNFKRERSNTLSEWFVGPHNLRKLIPQSEADAMCVGYSTIISVNESGTKVSSQSYAAGYASSSIVIPKTFKANRPFVYVIRETGTGMILFIGTYEAEPIKLAE